MRIESSVVRGRRLVIGALLGALVAGLMAAGPAVSASPAAESEESAERAPAPAVSRITGIDRYDLAAKVAVQTRPSGADVVYVASGANYPDALSAGPSAVHLHGALLLVQPDRVSPGVASALATLNPKKVVVVGGATSVSAAVVSELGAAVPRATVIRIAGADRYEVSRAIAKDAFRFGVADVFLATGRSFPDALSAVPGAASFDEPVVLVDGSLPGLDIPTGQLLDSLHVSSMALVGGTSSISAEMEFALGLGHGVARIDGADRYAVSLHLNDWVLQDYDTVYFATGVNFPDALAGGVLAGTTGSPMYLVPGDCVPRGVLTKLDRMGTTKVVLLGGPASLTDAVAALAPCSW